MTEALLAVAVLLLVLAFPFVWFSLKHFTRKDEASGRPFEDLARDIERLEKAVRDEAGRARDEQAKANREQRQEVSDSVRALGEALAKALEASAAAQRAQVEALSERLSASAASSSEKLDRGLSAAAAAAKATGDALAAEGLAQAALRKAEAEGFARRLHSLQVANLTKTSGEKLDGMRTDTATGSKQLREEVVQSLKGISDATTASMAAMAETQRLQLEAMKEAVDKLAKGNEARLEAVRTTVESRLQSLQADNDKRLEQMRLTVDEKLQGTLEKRLGESFKMVSDRLEQVHKGLGEMQSLATGVGDLKKVLTNVKTRGTWGEVQLGALLEQVLSPDQFERNVATKGGAERVEFAIKMPGQGPDERVWLPIDAKFPVEDYRRLVDAQERSDAEGVEAAGRQLEMRVKECAADISKKYLSPPATTDFGILYLPTEGLFAEVIRRTDLVEVIQRQYRVVVAGPTTLWSILSSLQMGFRTLAIQRRSSEVWNMLAAVKAEWEKYGQVLDQVKKRITSAADSLEKVQVRQRSIARHLRGVEDLPAEQAAKVLTVEKLLDEAPAEEDAEAQEAAEPGKA